MCLWLSFEEKTFAIVNSKCWNVKNGENVDVAQRNVNCSLLQDATHCSWSDGWWDTCIDPPVNSEWKDRSVGNKGHLSLNGTKDQDLCPEDTEVKDNMVVKKKKQLIISNHAHNVSQMLKQNQHQQFWKYCKLLKLKKYLYDAKLHKTSLS